MIRISLAQINPTVGDLKGNYRKITAFIKKARSREARIVVFPELALTGYPPEDLLLKKRFVSENLRFLDLVRRECAGLTVLLGCVDRDKNGIYNSCALIHDRKVRDVYRKSILPNYGVFDEKRYFVPGDTLKIYALEDQRFAVTICEDVWRRKLVHALEEKSLDFIVNISASPFYLGKVSQREKIMSYLAKRTGSFVVYCNLVGGQDEIVFDGTSKVFSPKGKIIDFAKRFSEDLLTFDLCNVKKYPAKRIDIKEEEELLSGLCLGLSDYIRKNGFKKVVLGVSGGIDSAVTLGLASMAVGPSNVCALIMPSRYTSEGTFKDARKICENLGVNYHVINIDGILKVYQTALTPHFKGKRCGKTEENLQARIRGALLMAFSNKFGYLVLNTGNKSELACGYCTLYGDMVGGFGVLKDVPKTLVYKLAKQINKVVSGKGIPASIIGRPPSAELKFNQKDTDSLPDYGLLDPILRAYIEREESLDEMAKRGLNSKIAGRVVRMVDKNEYKRRQAPIGIKITPRAFGKDRRMPITNRFR